MSEKTASASLRIVTDEMDLGFISEALGALPSAEHLRGELRSRRNPRSSAFEQSLWLYESPLPDCLELEKHIEAILAVLEVRQSQVARIRARIISLDIVCMFSAVDGQGSAILDHVLLQRLASQRINMVIDLYPPT